MNKTLLGVIGGAVVIGVVIFLVIGGGDKNGEQKAGDESSEQEQKMMQDGPKSLKELMALNAKQKCEFNDQTNVHSTEGVVYFDNGRMRGNFAAQSDSGAVNSHMIVKDNEVYVWEDGLGSAFKMSLSNVSDQDNGDSKSVDLDEKVDYRCEDWKVDSSVFDLPSGVDFQDFSAMMEAVMPEGAMGEEEAASMPANGQNLKALQCAACDQAPVESRAQCLQALGCN